MSVTVAKDKELTVVTITSDNKNMFPPLCQILGALCYSPKCCSVNKGLMKSRVTAVLGTIQIMLGLFTVALGPGRPFLHPRDLTEIGASYWLGAVYATVGTMSILAGHFPSLCLVGFSVLMNIVGSVFAVVGIGLYSAELQDIYMRRTMSWFNFDSRSPVLESLLTNADAVSVVMAAHQLCLCISLAVLGVKALVNKKNEEAGKHVEDQQPESKKILLTSPCASE